MLEPNPRSSITVPDLRCELNKQRAAPRGLFNQRVEEKDMRSVRSGHGGPCEKRFLMAPTRCNDARPPQNACCTRGRAASVKQCVSSQARQTDRQAPKNLSNSEFHNTNDRGPGARRREQTRPISVSNPDRIASDRRNPWRPSRGPGAGHDQKCARFVGSEEIALGHFGGALWKRTGCRSLERCPISGQCRRPGRRRAALGERAHATCTSRRTWCS